MSKQNKKQQKKSKNLKENKKNEIIDKKIIKIITNRKILIKFSESFFGPAFIFFLAFLPALFIGNLLFYFLVINYKDSFILFLHTLKIAKPFALLYFFIGIITVLQNIFMYLAKIKIYLFKLSVIIWGILIIIFSIIYGYII